MPHGPFDLLKPWECCPSAQVVCLYGTFFCYCAWRKISNFFFFLAFHRCLRICVHANTLTCMCVFLFPYTCVLMVARRAFCFNVWFWSVMTHANVSGTRDHAIFDSTPLCCRCSRCCSSFLCVKVYRVTDRLLSLCISGFWTVGLLCTVNKC